MLNYLLLNKYNGLWKDSWRIKRYIIERLLQSKLLNRKFSLLYFFLTLISKWPNQDNLSQSFSKSQTKAKQKLIFLKSKNIQFCSLSRQHSKRRLNQGIQLSWYFREGFCRIQRRSLSRGLRRMLLLWYWFLNRRWIKSQLIITLKTKNKSLFPRDLMNFLIKISPLKRFSSYVE